MSNPKNSEAEFSMWIEENCKLLGSRVFLQQQDRIDAYRIRLGLSNPASRTIVAAMTAVMDSKGSTNH